MRACLGLVLAALLYGGSPAVATDSQTLTLEAKIPLGNVKGRIDHLALDVSRQRLFVAELGNDSLGVVDLAAGRTLRTVIGLREPQGVGYVPSTDTIWVANGGDGTLRLFRGDRGEPDGVLALGDDADYVRVDAKVNLVYVGYGSGSIAIFNAITRNKVGEITLKAHPEGFELDSGSMRLYANVPDARQIAVIYLAAERQSETWVTKGSLTANFPLALDRESQRAMVGYRSPATLVVYDLRNGVALKHLPICGDTDDIGWVTERHSAYVACGEGFIDVVDLKDDHTGRIARVPTAKGARTLLYSPDFDRVYVAIRATEQVPAAIWIFRPDP